MSNLQKVLGNLNFLSIPESNALVKTAVSSNYTILASDVFLAVNTSAARVLTLPSTPNEGDNFYIKDISGNAGTNNITINPASGTIDGLSSYIIGINYGSVFIVYNGTEWNII